MKCYVIMPPDGNIYHCDSDKIVSDAEKFDNNSVLLVVDSITDSELVEIVQIRGRPKYIVSESYSFLNVPGLKIYSVAKWVEKEIERCIPRMKTIDQIQTTHSASFCVNKKQTNRHLLLKLSEMFQIKANYTWSGIGTTFDLSSIVEEKNQIMDNIIKSCFHEILEPIEMDKNWVGKGSNITESSIIKYGENYESWNSGLDEIIGNSAIHLIAESIISNTDACHFTEKTVYAMQGLTFPIWIGGKNQASEWKKYGFDIFEDIIDHSYESEDTLLERCFYAFYLNLELLQNKDKVAHLRHANIQRLQKNQQLLTHQTLKKYNDSIVSLWPEDLQQAIVPLFKKYCHVESTLLNKINN